MLNGCFRHIRRLTLHFHQSSNRLLVLFDKENIAMNSQIYCLPQKFGWNAAAEHGKKPKKEAARATKNEKPYFTVKFDGHEVSQQVREEFQRRYPRMGVPSPDSMHIAKRNIYISESALSFPPHFNYKKFKSPAIHEKRADPMRNPKPTCPPILTLIPRGSGPQDDSHKGYHPWRRLLSQSHDYIWQPMFKTDWSKDAPGRSTLHPVRMVRHDPTHEKERWDYARHLVRNNALSYSFRRNLIGYTGYKLREQDIMAPIERDTAHPNPAMESTTQAVHKEFSNEDYHQPEDHTANKHQGPMSRMVTLTHPYNPYTQQSAYSHVGAAGTQR